MKHLLLYIISFLVLQIVPLGASAAIVPDEASLKVMISNHKAVSTALNIRAATELGLNTLHNATKEGTKEYERLDSCIAKYERGMNWISTLLQGSAQVVHFGMTVKEAGENLVAYKNLLLAFEREFVEGVQVKPEKFKIDNIKLIKEDSIVFTTTKEMVERLPSDMKEVYKSLEELVAVVGAGQLGVTQMKLTELVTLLSNLNTSVDALACTINSAYYRLYSYIMMRRGFWKEGLFARRTMKEIVDDATSCWQRSQLAAAKVIIEKRPMDMQKVLGGGGLLGERRRKGY